MWRPVLTRALLMDGDVPENFWDASRGRCPLSPLEASVRTESRIWDSTCCIPGIEVSGFSLLAWCIKGNITLKILRMWTEMNLTLMALFWGDLAISPCNLVNIFFFIWTMPFLKQRGLSVISSKDWNRVGESLQREVVFFLLKHLQSWLSTPVGEEFLSWVPSCFSCSTKGGGWTFLGPECPH